LLQGAKFFAVSKDARTHRDVRLLMETTVNFSEFDYVLCGLHADRFGFFTNYVKVFLLSKTDFILGYYT